MIKIAPFIIEPICNCKLSEDNEKEEHENHHVPITYWGIYLNDRHVSYTSSRELAEKTKLWLEDWLKERR